MNDHCTIFVLNREAATVDTHCTQTCPYIFWQLDYSVLWCAKFIERLYSAQLYPFFKLWQAVKYRYTHMVRPCQLHFSFFLNKNCADVWKGEKKQWWPRARGWSPEFGMSCLGSILYNIHIKTQLNYSPNEAEWIYFRGGITHNLCKAISRQSIIVFIVVNHPNGFKGSKACHTNCWRKEVWTFRTRSLVKAEDKHIVCSWKKNTENT